MSKFFPLSAQILYLLLKAKKNIAPITRAHQIHALYPDSVILQLLNTSRLKNIRNTIAFSFIISDLPYMKNQYYAMVNNSLQIRNNPIFLIPKTVSYSIGS